MKEITVSSTPMIWMPGMLQGCMTPGTSKKRKIVMINALLYRGNDEAAAKLFVEGKVPFTVDNDKGTITLQYEGDAYRRVTLTVEVLMAEDMPDVSRVRHAVEMAVLTKGIEGAEDIKVKLSEM
jgi:hypothetical protein